MNTNHLMFQYKYMLIETDGYSITTTKKESLSEAQAEMQNRYNRYMPSELDEEWEDMSFCGENDAILYANGEDVYVWTIVEI